MKISTLIYLVGLEQVIRGQLQERAPLSRNLQWGPLDDPSVFPGLTMPWPFFGARWFKQRSQYGNTLLIPAKCDCEHFHLGNVAKMLRDSRKIPLSAKAEKKPSSAAHSQMKQSSAKRSTRRAEIRANCASNLCRRLYPSSSRRRRKNEVNDE